MNFTKSFLVVTLAGFMLVSCKETSAEAPANQAANTTKTTAAVGKVETASFNIEGMSCAVMCASKIEKELANAEGVQKAKVDFEKKTATVEYDANKTTPEKLVSIVEAVNGGDSYKVTNVKSSADHAMLFSKEKEKEKKRKSRKERKAEAEAQKSCTTEEAKSGKPACCSSKKSCSSEKTEEKKATTL